jgi:hypothetical protein
MRRHNGVPKRLKPSIRQSIAISSLLHIEQIWCGSLDVSDYIEKAIITSCPKIQDIAQQVAKEILFQLIFKQPKEVLERMDFLDLSKLDQDRKETSKPIRIREVPQKREKTVQARSIGD